MKVRLFFAWYDFWIGAYWSRGERILYVCPLPMVVISLSFKPWCFGTGPMDGLECPSCVVCRWRDECRGVEAAEIDTYLKDKGLMTVTDTGWKGDRIVLSQREFDDLLNYSASLPTGQTIGKRWRSRYQGGWFMGQYVEDPEPGMIGIKWCHIEIRKS